MKNVLSLFVLAGSIIMAQAVFADDTPVTTPAPAVAATVTAPAAEATVAAPVTEVAPAVAGMLKDGTKYTVDSDATVTLTNTDGTKSVAPDGDYTNEDDTTFNVKGGKKLTQ